MSRMTCWRTSSRALSLANGTRTEFLYFAASRLIRSSALQNRPVDRCALGGGEVELIRNWIPAKVVTQGCVDHGHLRRAASQEDSVDLQSRNLALGRGHDTLRDLDRLRHQVSGRRLELRPRDRNLL